jgi:hypothetical protein
MDFSPLSLGTEFSADVAENLIIIKYSRYLSNVPINFQEHKRKSNRYIHNSNTNKNTSKME